jgi:LCP family protein required for cell wall assembly
MRKRALLVLITCCILCLALACIGCSKKGNAGQEQPTAAPVATEKAPSTPFYVLVVGDDTRKGTIEITKPEYADGSGRSDVMMLVRVDPVNYCVSLVTVPRDTATTLDGQKTKINEAYNRGGIESAVLQVEDLTGVDIKYYFDMTFVQFEDFIEKMNGVTANVPIDMSLVDIVHGDTITLEQGDDQDLNGEEALVLARQRKQYAEDIEACRQIQDRQIVQRLIQKVLEQPTDQAGTYAAILTGASETNMKVDVLQDCITQFMNHAGEVTFQSGTGPYSGDVDASDQLWYVPRDEATWAEVMKVVEANGDPTTVVALPIVRAK